jgi:DNA-binding MarR family transcriptional regulator
LSTQEIGTDAFVALVRAHADGHERLNAQLATDHGLTISDFEVLLRLARAPDHRLRRVDLAQQVVLTPSGITRLLDGLERQGWVERASCSEDRRVVYAVITVAGVAKLREARSTHVPQSEEHFAPSREPREPRQLLGRLGGEAPDLPCDADL